MSLQWKHGILTVGLLGNSYSEYSPCTISYISHTDDPGKDNLHAHFTDGGEKREGVKLTSVTQFMVEPGFL